MAITQIIATLPAVLNDSATFYEDIAERNNSLVTTVLPSINAWATQANTTQAEINAKAAQVAAQAVDGGYSQNYINDNFFSQNYINTNFVGVNNAQNITAVKTFIVSPIVPTPTTDFQSVPLRSTNITVDVGAGQTYTTINQALEYLSGFYPMYKKSGVTATINLKAGFVMAEQVLVSGIDLGWITIVGEDAETIITHTALTTAFNGTNYPTFGVDKGGTSPVIGQLFRFNVEKVGGAKHGLLAVGAGSIANVLSGKGFIGAGTHGILANNASTINAQGANCSNAGVNGMFADRASTINAYLAIIQNQTTGTNRVRVVFGSNINATAINTTGGTVPVFSQTTNTLTAEGIIYQ